MTDSQYYDAIVIGSGQAGTPLSVALAQAGRKTALIERQHVGGTCVNEGCTPTKTMVASARVAYLARRGADYGVQTDTITVNQVRVRQRKRDIVNSFRSGSERRIEITKDLDLVAGEASFLGPKTILVRLNEGGQKEMTGGLIFINTGTRSIRPALEGLKDVPFLDNSSIMELDSVPEHLLVLGGGYIGLEFGQMFRRFGSRVTIVQSRDQLLTREDTDVAGEVETILRQDGIEILLETKAMRVSKTDGRIQLQVRTRNAERVVTGSHLLVAVGRTPNTEGLQLPMAGVETDAHGFIKSNGRLETNVSGVYALGDVKGGPAFTHISYDDFRIIRTNLIEGGNASTTGRLVPYTVFIDPQLGRVGITEREARKRGLNVLVAKMPMDRVARALETDETRGFMKAIVDADSRQILGAAVLGIEGGEIMAIFEVSMMGHLPYTSLRDGIFAHPTLAESLNNLFSAPMQSIAGTAELRSAGAA
jgi:pyruvate/2-oxoglutarate dehydrogenase complex dihydrolipoamide dehydrogenase (E3) component